MTEPPDSQRRLHHVGVVVRDIDAEVDRFAWSIGAGRDTPIFFDPLQKVRVTFLRPSSVAEPQIELVEPAGEDSPVWSFLRGGGGLHHLCYEVDDLDSSLRNMKERGNIIIRPPVPAVAFEGRRIAWVVTRPKLLTEFLERATAGAAVVSGTGRAV